MKRKIISITLISTLIGCLVGCGGQTQVADEETGIVTEATETIVLPDVDAELENITSDTQENVENPRPNPFEEKPVLVKSDLTEEQQEFRNDIQAKYDEIIEKHRQAGDEVSMYEDIHVTDAFIYSLEDQGITTFDGFWNYIVELTDSESNKVYAGADPEDRYETIFVLTVAMGCYEVTEPEDIITGDTDKDLDDVEDAEGEEDPGRYKPRFDKPETNEP